MTHLKFESYVFDPRPRYPLVTTAKRYWHPQFYSEDPDALTLIFVHGTGFHKEQWEPTLEYLYDISSRNGGMKIREAWSIDCPNHGDAVVLNEEELSWGYRQFPWGEYARSVHDFLTGQGKGIPVDFSSRKLVGIGHSMGAVALILSTTHLPKLEFSSLILVDPMLFPKPPSNNNKAPITIDFATATLKRRDIWESREDALNLLLSRGSTKNWDPAVVKNFVEYGLRDLPTSDYPDKTTGVTLKCSKFREAATYGDGIAIPRGYNLVKYLCLEIPVHFIYGAIDDYIPAFVKQDVLEKACNGKYASVSRVEGAGHLVPQMQPKRLADAIYTALRGEVVGRSQGEETRYVSRL